MDEQEPRKRQTTGFSREARDRRIFERAREGFPYDEIGREEGSSAERVRQNGPNGSTAMAQPFDKAREIVQIFPTLLQRFPSFSKPEPNPSKFSFALPMKTTAPPTPLKRSGSDVV